MALQSSLIRTSFLHALCSQSKYRLTVTLIPDIHILSLASPVSYSTEVRTTTLPMTEMIKLLVDVPYVAISSNTFNFLTNM